MNHAAARFVAVPRVVWAGIAVSWAAGIFTLSALPGETLGDSGPARAFLFNLCHAPLFAGLGTLVGLAMLAREPVPLGARARMLGAFALVMLYAVSDELHQASVPGRSSDGLDLVTDAAGAWGGVLLAATLVRFAGGGPVRPRGFVAPVLLAVLAAGAATFDSV